MSDTPMNTTNSDKDKAMTSTAVEAPDPTGARFPARPRSPIGLAYDHLKTRKIAMGCFGLLILYFLIAFSTYLRLPGEASFVGEWFEARATHQFRDPLGEPLNHIPPHWNTLEMQPDGKKITSELIAEWTAPPRLDLVLGTDIQGRSVLWRTLYGTRLSLTIALGATILALSIGTVLGAMAGYLGGWVDVLITWLFTTVASIPRILLILALAYSLKGQTIPNTGWLPFVENDLAISGVVMLIGAMGLTSWVSLCRIIRGEILKQKSMDYEAAARAIGLSKTRILMRHLLPNATYLIIIQASLIFPLFIHLEVILSYLGLGVNEGISWGQMINESLQEIIRTPPVWWQLAGATLAIFGISLALNMFGDALRDALDPRLQSSGGANDDDDDG